MTDEELLIERIYHSIQHIQSDLENYGDIDKIRSIEHTVNHILIKIENYYAEKK